LSNTIAMTWENPSMQLIVGELGYSKVLINCVGLLLVFLFFSLLFVAIGRWRRWKNWFTNEKP